MKIFMTLMTAMILSVLMTPPSSFAKEIPEADKWHVGETFMVIPSTFCLSSDAAYTYGLAYKHYAEIVGVYDTQSYVETQTRSSESVKDCVFLPESIEITFQGVIEGYQPIPIMTDVMQDYVVTSWLRNGVTMYGILPLPFVSDMTYEEWKVEDSI